MPSFGVIKEPNMRFTELSFTEVLCCMFGVTNERDKRLVHLFLAPSTVSSRNHELFTEINSRWPLIKTECLKKPAPHSQSESKRNLSSKPPVRVGLTMQTFNWVVCQCVLDVEVDFRTLVRHTEASRLPCLLCSHRFKTEQSLELSLIIKEQC